MVFKNYPVTGSEVEMGTKTKVKVCGRSYLILKVTIGTYVYRGLLQNVLYVPGFEYLLTSMSDLDINGIFTTFGKGQRTLKKNGKIS